MCEDYSRLFKAMCDETGLESVMVTGNARDFYKPYRNAHDNPHAWNAVKIDGEWYLLDATWAAGYTNPEVTKFTRKLMPGFFMTQPEWFVQGHFPDEEQWQLLDRPVDKKSFSKLPLINFGQDRYPITDFSEQVTTNGGEMEFRIKLEQKPKYLELVTRKGKPVKHTRKTEDGFEVFRFSGRGIRDVILVGGPSRSRLSWMARYDL